MCLRWWRLIFIKNQDNIWFTIETHRQFSTFLVLKPNPEKCEIAHLHRVKSVQNRSNFWSVFSHIRTEHGAKYLSVFSPNAGKHGPEITPYLDTFHAVLGPLKKVKVAVCGMKCIYLRSGTIKILGIFLSYDKTWRNKT